MYHCANAALDNSYREHAQRNATELAELLRAGEG
jgi:hypothetical protein